MHIVAEITLHSYGMLHVHRALHLDGNGDIMCT